MESSKVITGGNLLAKFSIKIIVSSTNEKILLLNELENWFLHKKTMLNDVSLKFLYYNN